METNKTVVTVFLDQNAAFSEVHNKLMNFNSSATILATTFLRNKHFDKAEIRLTKSYLFFFLADVS